MERYRSVDLDTPVKDKSRGVKRKRNIIAKTLRDQGDYKGAFALKVVNPKKQEYKRKRIRVNEVNDYEEND